MLFQHQLHAAAGRRAARALVVALLVGVVAGAALNLQAADWSAESDEADAIFGSDLAAAGDVNGDGYDDLLIGALGCNQGGLDRGCAYVYMGSATGLAPNWAWRTQGPHSGSGYGTVSGAGDVNNDGYDDVLVAAPGFSDSHDGQGKVWLFLGSDSGLATTAVWSYEGGDGWFLGATVAGGGDVNGDGFDDVLVGAPLYTNGEFEEGAALVFHGSAGGPATTPSWSAEGNDYGLFFGSSLDMAGDVNGDGYTDIIVGIPYKVPPIPEGTTNPQGVAEVYLGSTTGLAATPVWVGTMNENRVGIGGQYGETVSGVGDVNGDGFDDVAVAANRYNTPSTQHTGRVWLYMGSPSGPDLTDTWAKSGSTIHSHYGWDMNGDGDITGDGKADVLFGAQIGMGFGLGGAFMFDGRWPFPFGQPQWSGSGTETGAAYGDSVAHIGDVNGDGLGDWAVGAQYQDNPEHDEGVVWVHHGCAEADIDGVCDTVDNCVVNYNPNQSDGDADDHGDVCDCNDVDSGLWSAPDPASNLMLAAGGTPEEALLSWTASTLHGSIEAPLYDVIRSASAGGFDVGATCVEADDDSDTAATDAALPGVGGIHYFLVRSENGCGSLVTAAGRASDGTPRTVQACP